MCVSRPCSLKAKGEHHASTTAGTSCIFVCFGIVADHLSSDLAAKQLLSRMMRVAAPAHDRVNARHELRNGKAVVLAAALPLPSGSGDVENGTDPVIRLCGSDLISVSHRKQRGRDSALVRLDRRYFCHARTG